MLQGRLQADSCPAGRMDSASLHDNDLNQQQHGAGSELPQDMARQALAATGGRSTLMATKWLLERRAEVALQHPDAEAKKPRNNEDLELGSLLPSTGVAWGNDGLQAEAEKGSSFAREGVTLPIDWPRPPNALERHLSIGCSSPRGKDDVGSSSPRGKLQPVVAESQPLVTKVCIPLHSPDAGETGKVHASKLAIPNMKRKWHDTGDVAGTKPTGIPSINLGFKQQSVAMGKTPASLAERMRPNSIAEILGQDHLLLPQGALISLLDAQSLPCIIFTGPPGTGKTCLARLIARSASCRFVVFPRPKGGNTEVQDILDEAKQMRKFGQRTVLFVENLSRFNKFQQECLLPALDAGYVVFIGATTENPSLELISSLFARCQVFVLKKLQPDHLCIAMKWAMSDLERGVLVSLGDVTGIEFLAIEDDAVQYIANAADGDARLALNALEASVYIALGKLKHKHKLETEAIGIPVTNDDEASFKHTADWDKSVTTNTMGKAISSHKVMEHLKGTFHYSQEEYVKPFKKIVGGKESIYRVSKDKVAQIPKVDTDKDTESQAFRDKSNNLIDSETTLVVTVMDAKEALRWPQVVLEKSQEENAMDLISVLLRSMKGGDSNAAVYWLARVLETSEGRAKVSTSLIKFACDEIGMADPQALVQATACHQACLLLDIKECTSHLTQCVVYLSMAPKSDAMARAFKQAQKVVEDGPYEPIPVHLRSSMSKAFPRELGYLPPSLRAHTFLEWPNS